MRQTPVNQRGPSGRILACAAAKHFSDRVEHLFFTTLQKTGPGRASSRSANIRLEGSLGNACLSWDLPSAFIWPGQPQRGRRFARALPRG